MINEEKYYDIAQDYINDEQYEWLKSYIEPLSDNKLKHYWYQWLKELDLEDEYCCWEEFKEKSEDYSDFYDWLIWEIAPKLSEWRE